MAEMGPQSQKISKSERCPPNFPRSQAKNGPRQQGPLLSQVSRRPSCLGTLETRPSSSPSASAVSCVNRLPLGLPLAHRNRSEQKKIRSATLGIIPFHKWSLCFRPVPVARRIFPSGKGRTLRFPSAPSLSSWMVPHFLLFAPPGFGSFAGRLVETRSCFPSFFFCDCAFFTFRLFESPPPPPPPPPPPLSQGPSSAFFLLFLTVWTGPRDPR